MFKGFVLLKLERLIELIALPISPTTLFFFSTDVACNVRTLYCFSQQLALVPVIPELLAACW